MARRILVYCESWESGGIESFLAGLLSRLDLEAFQVDLACAQLKPSVFTAGLEALGVRFVELSGSQKRVWENHRLFRALLETNAYDAVHLNAFQGMTLYYAHLAKQAGVGVRIAHSHNTALRKSLTRPLKLALHRLYARRYAPDATALWACSEDAARFLFPASVLNARGWQFVPNGIDTARFRFDPAVRASVRRELGLDSALVIGHVGRLTYQKNQSFLLTAFADLVQVRPESRLVLVGEGEDRAALEARARALGIEDRVIFHGPSTRVPALLWAMDVFAFPSVFEGLGIAAVEAQAAGLPTLCSEHVPREAGVTPLFTAVPLSQGPEGWARALLEAAKTQTDRAEAADLVYQAGFDVSEVAARTQEGFGG